MGSQSNTTSSFLIGARMNGQTSKIEAYTSAKYYGIKIFKDGAILRNFIPCVRKSDNIAGMYDTIGKKFYKSATSTEFSAG